MKYKNKILILAVLFTTNNVLYTLTNSRGDVLFWTSVGSKKVKGIKKTTSTLILSVMKEIIEKVFRTEYKYIFVKIKGFNKNKKSLVKFISQSSLNILLISDKTCFPHNGCKKASKKRI